MELYKIIDRFVNITKRNASNDQMTRFMRLSFNHKKRVIDDRYHRERRLFLKPNQRKVAKSYSNYVIMILSTD